MWILPAVGACRPSGLGCGTGRPPPGGLRRAIFPTRAKGATCKTETLTESALHPRAHTCVARTPRAAARVASLAHSPRRRVLCGTSVAERRVAQRSTAQHSACKHGQCTKGHTVHTHAHVSCTVVPSCLELHPHCVHAACRCRFLTCVCPHAPVQDLVSTRWGRCGVSAVLADVSLCGHVCVVLLDGHHRRAWALGGAGPILGQGCA